MLACDVDDDAVNSILAPTAGLVATPEMANTIRKRMQAWFIDEFAAYLRAKFPTVERVVEAPLTQRALPENAESEEELPEDDDEDDDEANDDAEFDS